MNTQDLVPTLMIEMRERLVRIETKMDSSAEKVDKLQADSDDTRDRLAVLETEATQLRSSMNTLKWVGGAIVTAATLFGDSLIRLF